MLAQITRNPFTTTATNGTSATSLGFDISGFTVNEWVYAFFCGKTSVSGLGATGWTTAIANTNVGAGGQQLVQRRYKVTGDTTFTLTWTGAAQFCVALCQWYGLNKSTPDESGLGQTQTGISGNDFVTPAFQQAQGYGREVVAVFTGVTGVSGSRQLSWTSSASGINTTPTVTAYDPNTAGSWPNIAVFDSVGTGFDPFPGVSNSFDAVCTPSTVTNGASGIMYLVPAVLPQNQIVSQAVNTSAIY